MGNPTDRPPVPLDLAAFPNCKMLKVELQQNDHDFHYEEDDDSNDDDDDNKKTYVRHEGSYIGKKFLIIHNLPSTLDEFHMGAFPRDEFMPENLAQQVRALTLLNSGSNYKYKLTTALPNLLTLHVLETHYSVSNETDFIKKERQYFLKKCEALPAEQQAFRNRENEQSLRITAETKKKDKLSFDKVIRDREEVTTASAIKLTLLDNREPLTTIPVGIQSLEAQLYAHKNLAKPLAELLQILNANDLEELHLNYYSRTTPIDFSRDILPILQRYKNLKSMTLTHSFKNVTLENLPALQQFYLYHYVTDETNPNNKIEKVILRNLPKLQILKMNSRGLIDLTIAADITGLIHASLDNLLSSVDLSNQPNLRLATATSAKESSISILRTQQQTTYSLDDDCFISSGYNFSDNIVNLRGEIAAFIVKDSDMIDPDQIQYSHFSQLNFDPKNKKLHFSAQPFAFTAVTNLPSCEAFQKEHSTSTAKTFMRIRWEAQSIVSVVTTGQYQQVVAIDAGDDIQVGFDKNTQRWLLKNNSNEYKSSEVSILLSNPSNKKPLPYAMLPISDQQQLFAKSIQQIVQESAPTLLFIYDEKQTLAARIHQAMQYFREFERGLAEATDEIALFAEALNKKHGVCRHIAFIFSVLLQSMGVVSFPSLNDRHALALVAHALPSGEFVWNDLPVSGYGKRINPIYSSDEDLNTEVMKALSKRVELSDAQYQVWCELGINASMTENEVQQHFKKAEVEEPGELSKLLVQFKQRQRATHPEYIRAQQFFKKQVVAAQLNSTQELLTQTNQCHVLIRLDVTATPMMIHFALCQYWLETNNALPNYLYISKPSDLQLYWKSLTIQNGSTSEQIGPLKQYLQKQSFILINWSAFSEDEMTFALSMLEKDHRHFNSVPMTSDCKVIGLIANNQEPCVAFQTRCREFFIGNIWSAQLNNKMPTALPEAKEAANTLPIRCYQDPNWQSALYGNITCQKGQWGLTTSPLQTAMAKDQELVLLDPTAATIESLVEHAVIERRVYFNGQFIPTTHLKLSVNKKSYELIIPDNVKVIVDTLPPENTPYFILNSQTYPDLLTLLTSDSDGLLSTESGLLEKNPQLSWILISDDMTLLWPRIELAIAQSKRPLNLGFLPGGCLGNYQSENKQAIPISTQIILTSRLQTEASWLEARIAIQYKKSRRIYIDPAMNYSDLLAKIYVALTEDNTCAFTEERHEVLPWLQNNDLILIGNPSLELNLQLQSMFCLEPHLWWQGKRLTFNGKIHLIANDSEKLPLYPAYTKSNLVKLPELLPRPVIKLTADEWSKRPLEDKITTLVGEPGAGKSHATREWTQRSSMSSFFGEKSFIKYLTSKNPKGNAIVINEINTPQNGYWNFLYGLIDGSNTLFYAGKWFLDLEKHFVIGTMNPNSEVNRNEHDILTSYAQMNLIVAQTAEWLVANIAGPILKNRALAELVVQCHLFTTQYAKQFHFSLRDLISLCHRMLLDPKKSVHEQVVLQYGLSLKNATARRDFREQIAKITPPDHSSKEKYTLIKQFIITPSRQPIAELIRLQLKLRYCATIVKSHILLHGNSATSKTSLYMAILESEGYQLNHPDVRKRFYHVNARSPDCADILLKAFYEGALVVLEEANCCSCMELLSQLLDGRDLNDQPSPNKGFAVFASQNPATYVGRAAQSSAMISRYHCAEMNEYEVPELRECARIANKSNPSAFVDGFEVVRKQHSVMNHRLFFPLLWEKEEFAEKQAVIRGSAAYSV